MPAANLQGHGLHHRYADGTTVDNWHTNKKNALGDQLREFASSTTKFPRWFKLENVLSF